MGRKDLTLVALTGAAIALIAAACILCGKEVFISLHNIFFGAGADGT